MRNKNPKEMSINKYAQFSQIHLYHIIFEAAPLKVVDIELISLKKFAPLDFMYSIILRDRKV